MPNHLKISALFIADAMLMCAAQILTLMLLNQSFANSFTPALSVLIFTSISWLNGFYKSSISHLGIGAVKLATPSIFFSGGVMFLLEGSGVFAVFSSALAFVAFVGYRVLARELLFQQRHHGAARTLVYGAGSAGVQFTTASMQGRKHNVVGYIDDDLSLCGKSIHGRDVHPSKNIEVLIKKYAVEIIVLALPSLSRAARKKIIEPLIPFPVRVVTVPDFEDLIEGKLQINETEDLTIEDLLGRDPVPPIDRFMQPRTTNKVCLVTGAGGSIGSELCRQIVKCKPKHLVLLDVSEPALFAIEQALLNENFSGITCCLGSVTDKKFIEGVFKNHDIDCVYHAAAYKHVPMVEANPLAGLINNVAGTQTVLSATLSHRCESFTLISTDKAVRPTNIMGATKRLAEMVCQLAAESTTGPTIISMVRFGNVLGSSGSVIHLSTTNKRRPVTLTPEITRYFMTIPEAAARNSSVRHGGTGDLFLLDMGKPIKIIDLATRLIRLSENLSSKIRQGNPGRNRDPYHGGSAEQLCEELLVDAYAQPAHPPKSCGRMSHTYRTDITLGMKDLMHHLYQSNEVAFKEKLAELVVGYRPSELNKIV